MATCVNLTAYHRQAQQHKVLGCITPAQSQQQRMFDTAAGHTQPPVGTSRIQCSKACVQVVEAVQSPDGSKLYTVKWPATGASTGEEGDSEPESGNLSQEKLLGQVPSPESTSGKPVRPPLLLLLLLHKPTSCM